MTTTVREAPHHRSLYCVKQFGCRRPECRARSQAYARRRYRQVGYGTWHPLVDAEPVRQHIAALRAAGNSLPRIQSLAGVSAATIARILYDGVNPRADRIRTDAAQRILNVPVQAAPTTANTIIDATGTRRRIQALVAMGWTLTALGPRLGFHPRRLTDLLHADRVLASTARRIAIAYRTVQTLDPADHGFAQHGRTLARNMAAREGWHGPLAWDDIDNPDAKPQTAKGRARPGKARLQLDPQRVQRLSAEGLSADQIAERFGVHKRTVVRARSKAREQVAA